MENNENFVNWFYMGGQESAISVNVDGQILPKLVHHGTIGKVSPLIGFWDRHMGMDERVLAGIYKIEDEAEKASHFGMIHQAIERVKDVTGEYPKTSRGNWDQIHNAIYSPDEEDSRLPDSKFYSGWIKMNNPLRMKDYGHFEFDTILNHLAGQTRGSNNENLMKNFTYSILSPTDPTGGAYTRGDNIPDFENKGTDFPLLVSHFGQGTALEQVLNYAREFYEEDMNRTGVELDDWNEEWGSMSKGEQANIHYYKMHGLIKFIQQDLGYDGIIYENRVEDANAEADSYILFHPWQFKSMYNKGTFSKKRNFLSKTKRKNKYQKVA